MSIPKLIYFSTRGRAESIRLLLAEAGVEYEEVGLGTGFGGKGHPAAFTELQQSGRLAFGAVPMWEEPGLRLVQSDAILRYLAHKHHLFGATLIESAQCDMVMEGVKDVRVELIALMRTPPDGIAALRKHLLESVLPRWLGFFDKLLEPSTSGFFVGNTLTCADLVMFSLLEALTDNGLDAPLQAHPKLLAFKQRVAERPRIAAWIASPKRYPVHRLPHG